MFTRLSSIAHEPAELLRRVALASVIGQAMRLKDHAQAICYECNDY